MKLRSFSNEELLKRVRLWGKQGRVAEHELMRRILFGKDWTWEQIRERVEGEDKE